jgi:hypothetical protein
LKELLYGFLKWLGFIFLAQKSSKAHTSLHLSTGEGTSEGPEMLKQVQHDRCETRQFSRQAVGRDVLELPSEMLGAILNERHYNFFKTPYVRMKNVNSYMGF